MIPVLFVLPALCFGVCFGVSQIIKNPGKYASKKETVPVVFDALQYEVKDKKNSTEAELIEQLGEPDRIEDWSYKTAGSRSSPIRTPFLWVQ